MTGRELLTEASALIAQRDAELLLGKELQRERAWIFAHREEPVAAEAESNFREKVSRRAAGEPLQYIVGEQEFFGLPIQVTPAVLIPRPETEHLVESVLEWAREKAGPLRIVDVGTGSGAISLALAKHLPMADITAIDISTDALAVAQSNAFRLGLGGRISFVEGDLLGGVASEMDVVVSNPPYIPASNASTMQREVVEHEPHTALFAGADGLDVYKRLIPAAEEKLRAGGLLAMEFGYGQRDALAQLLSGWEAVRFVSDYAGIPRVALAERA